jgi:hypothetical protein
MRWGRGETVGLESVYTSMFVYVFHTGRAWCVCVCACAGVARRPVLSFDVDVSIRGAPRNKASASAAPTTYAEKSVAYVACAFPPLLVCCFLTMDGAALAGMCRSLEEQRRYRLLRE